MKKSRQFIILLIALMANNFSIKAQEEINILFIGNSFTFRHDLNLFVEELVHKGHPNLNIYYERSVLSINKIKGAKIM